MRYGVQQKYRPCKTHGGRGEVTPGSRPTENSPAINRLLSTMTDEQKSIFEKYEAAAEEAQWLTREDTFAEGIRFSLRLFTEAL